MDHIAIMNKSWDMIPRILKGTKKIESRWEKNKCAPWGKIKRGENIYFKNAGEPIIARAKVDKLIEFENLSKKDVREILKKYGGKDGIDEPDLGKIVKWAENKHYCTLIYLKDPKKIKPFNINKKGFGAGAAWIILKNIKTIKII